MRGPLAHRRNAAPEKSSPQEAAFSILLLFFYLIIGVPRHELEFATQLSFSYRSHSVRNGFQAT
jgi:hypothetical protein